MNLRSRLERLEERSHTVMMPIRIVRHLMAPSPNGPELVGIHRDGVTIWRTDGEKAFLTRGGEA